MWTPQQKAQCAAWYIETKSETQVQRNVRTRYACDPPTRATIKAWHKQFMETGNVLHQKGAGKPSTSQEDVERVSQAFRQSPTKSVRKAARELNMPKTTVHDVLRKRLKLHPYKVQLLQALLPTDKPRRADFANDILNRIEHDNQFLQKICFSDEATFHVSGQLNRHNVRIWGSENPHVTREMERDSPKVNVWCGLMHNRIIGPFFFAEKSITAPIYLDLLQLYVIPQLENLQPNILFQQDGAPPHWSLDVREYLDNVFPNRWIGRDGPISWPPRSPDVTPLDFFLWGYIKDIVFATKVADLAELKQRILAAFETVTDDLLQRTWAEIDFRLHVLRITHGAHIEVY